MTASKRCTSPTFKAVVYKCHINTEVRPKITTAVADLETVLYLIARTLFIASVQTLRAIFGQSHAHADSSSCSRLCAAWRTAGLISSGIEAPITCTTQSDVHGTSSEHDK